MTTSGAIDLLERDPAFVLECEIAVPLPELHAFLCDLHRYVPLHPFIESIQDLPALPELPKARRYRVVDRIPILPFASAPKMKTIYTAALDPVNENEVHGYAWQSPGIRLQTVYRLEKSNLGTRLIESCHVDAHPLMRGFVVSQARKAHAETHQELKALLEDAPPGFD